MLMNRYSWRKLRQFKDGKIKVVEDRWLTGFPSAQTGLTALNYAIIYDQYIHDEKGDGIALRDRAELSWDSLVSRQPKTAQWGSQAKPKQGKTAIACCRMGWAPHPYPLPLIPLIPYPTTPHLC